RASRANSPAAVRIDYFGNVCRFEHVQHARLRAASVADGPHFGHPMMIHDARAVPKLLDVSAGSRDAAAKLAGDENRSHLGSGQVYVLFGGDFAQTNGVSGGATEDGRARIDDGTQASGAAHTASGDRQAAHSGGGFERQPESEKGPEREGEENGV